MRGDPRWRPGVRIFHGSQEIRQLDVIQATVERTRRRPKADYSGKWQIRILLTRIGHLWSLFQFFLPFFGHYFCHFGHFSSHVGTFLDIFGHVETFWVMLGHFGTFWDILGHFGTFWDILGHFGTCAEILAAFRSGVLPAIIFHWQCGGNGARSSALPAIVFHW